MKSLPPLQPTDRGIFVEIAADLHALAELFDLDGNFGDKGSMPRVKMLDRALESYDAATTILIGRLLPNLDRSHCLADVSGLADMRAPERNRLPGKRYPLNAATANRFLDEKVIESLRWQPENLRAAVMDPEADIKWSLPEVEITIAQTGISQWPAHPQSWLKWRSFIEKDKRVEAAIELQAVRCNKDFDDELKSVAQRSLYLSGINSAELRSTPAPQPGRVPPRDLLAEIVGKPISKVMRTHLEQRRVLASLPGDYGRATPADTSPDVELRDLIESKLPQPHLSVINFRLAGLTDEEIVRTLNAIGQCNLECVRSLEQLLEFLSFLENLSPEDGTSGEDSRSDALDLLRKEAEAFCELKNRDLSRIYKEAVKMLGLRIPSGRRTA